jgi:cystathionine beta-lyase
MTLSDPSLENPSLGNASLENRSPENPSLENPALENGGPLARAQAGRWTTRKWEVGDGEIGAWIAESDFGTAPAVIAALHEAIDAEFLTDLPDHAAQRAESACAAFLGERYGWSVDAARVHLVPDVVEGLRITIRTFTEPGAAIVVPTPCYAPFLDVPQTLGRRVIQVPSALVDGRWRIDLAALERAFADGGGLLLLCNPHNPLGQVMTVPEMLEVAEIVERRGARVFSDEIHAPVVYAGAKHVPYASLDARTARHTVTATATSKGWNIPGLKAAQLILSADADQELWRRLDVVPSQSGSILGAVAATTAYSASVGWLDETVARFDHNRRLLARLLSEHAPAIGYTIPQATYLAWLDLRAYALPLPPAAFIARHAGVVASDGAASGLGGEGFVRFNFAMPPALLHRTVRAIGAALAPYAPR